MSLYASYAQAMLLTQVINSEHSSLRTEVLPFSMAECICQVKMPQFPVWGDN